MSGALPSRDRSIFMAAYAAGLVTFALLYSPQPILYLLAVKFDVSPHVSALVISLPTFFLSLASILMLAIAGIAAPSRLVPGAIIAAAVINFAAALSPLWSGVIAGRSLVGILIGLVPASVMGFVSAEIPPERMGRAMSWYIAGTGSGGLIGRLVAGIFAETYGYEAALAGMSGVAFIVGLVLWFRFPASSTAGQRCREGPGIDWAALRMALTMRATASIYVLCFLLMGTFAGIFNYLSFLLSSPAFGLSQANLTFSFLPIAVGTFAVPLFGVLYDRFGPRRMLCFAFATILGGAVLSLTDSLPLLFLAITIVAIGSFAGHSSASATLGRQQSVNKAYASSLYMFSFYMGASTAGYFTGVLYTVGGWPMLVGFTAVLSVIGIAITLLAFRHKASG